MSKERIAIIVLCVLLIWFGLTIIRLESYHHAVQIGYCSYEDPVKRYGCLEQKTVEIHSFWHLFYALEILK